MEDPREEIARLKEHLHRVQEVCNLHRKLGEDTEFEIRELKRRSAEARVKLEILQHHFRQIKVTDENRLTIDSCTWALEGLAKLIEAL